MSNENYAKRRNRDNQVEANMQSHLDQLYKENNIKTERITDSNLQRRGVDIIYTDDGNKYYADEKSASTYFNTKLKTFAFELACSVNTNGRGWFQNSPFLLTEYYFLAYPFAENNKDNLQTLDELEVLIISKQVLWDYVHSLGFNSSEDVIREFQKNGHVQDRDGRLTKRWVINNDVKVVQSLYIKPEQPTNIIFSKNLLKKLAKKHIVKKFS